ncbi:MAG: hypothetical protein ABI315_03860 [Bacteroidia bacterium]
MKKLILAVAVIAALASCKKERTCSCTSGTLITINKDYQVNDTKSKAKTFCDDKQIEIRKVASDATCMLK